MKSIYGAKCSIFFISGIIWGIRKNTPIPAISSKRPQVNCNVDFDLFSMSKLVKWRIGEQPRTRTKILGALIVLVLEKSNHRARTKSQQPETSCQ